MIVGIFGENPNSKAIATLIAEAGHTPKIGKETSGFKIRGFSGTPQWSVLSKEAELLIFTATESLEADLKKAELSPHNQVLVSAGLEPTSLLWHRQIVSQHTPAIRVGTIGGALLTDEIADRTPTSLVIASAYDSVNDLAQEALHSDICRVYFSSDCLGVDLVHAFVPVIQLAMGIADALQCGGGTRGAIVSRGLIEGSRLGMAMGADEHSFLGIAGIGHLIATFQESDFYQHGQQTIYRNAMPTVALNYLHTIERLNADFKVQLPLMSAIHMLGQGKLSPTLLIDGLMRRKSTRE